MTIKLILLCCFVIGVAAEAKKTPSLTEQDNFFTLMGVHTARWKYVKNAKDAEDLAFFKKNFDKNKEAIKSPSPVYKIPRTVHFIWLGPRNFPIDSIQNVRTWMARHPDWTFKFWTDSNRPLPCEGMELHRVKDEDFQYLLAAYSKSKNWGQKSDFLRYEILLKEGGAYVDHDANCLRSFDLLHRSYDLYGCLELPHWKIGGRHITAGNGLFGARPGHPVVKRAIERVLELSDLPFNEKNIQKSVWNTGYIAFTDALMTHQNLEENVDIVFPAAYFFSCEGLASLYSHHFYWNAWDENYKVVTKEQTALLERVKKGERQSKLLACGIPLFLLFLLINNKRRRSL